MKSKVQILRNYTIALLFLLFLIFTHFDAFFNITQTKNIENTNNLKLTLNNFKQQYKNEFKGRSFLFNAIANIKYHLLNVSILPERVKVGKNGYLFVGDYFQNAVKKNLNLTNYNKKNAAELNNKLLKLNSFCKSKNIKLYILKIHDRQFVLKDLLFYKNKTKTLTFDEELKNLNLPFLHFFEPKEKKDELYKKYHKYNSHWNLYGAYDAYKFIFKQIKKDFNAAKFTNINNFEIDTVLKCNKSLAMRLDLNVCENYYQVKKYNNKFKTVFKKSATINSASEKHIKNFTANNNLNVLVYHDSFFNNLMPFTNCSFTNIKYLWTKKIKKQDILKHKPDILIVQSVNRLFAEIDFN